MQRLNVAIAADGPPETPMAKLEEAISVLNNKAGYWCGINP